MRPTLLVFKPTSLATQAAKKLNPSVLTRCCYYHSPIPLVHTTQAYQTYSKRGLLSRAKKSPDKSMTKEQSNEMANTDSNDCSNISNTTQDSPSSKSSHAGETSTVAIKEDHSVLSGFDSEEEDIQLTLMEDVVIDDFLIDPDNNPKFQAMLTQWSGRPDGCRLMYRILERPRHSTVLRKLMEEGSNDPTLLPGDPKSRSPLMYAAEHGNVTAIEQLLTDERVQKRIDKCESVTGKSALLFALLNNHRKAVRFLIQNGCDDSIADRKGYNIYQICIVNPGLLTMLEYVLKHSQLSPNDLRGVVQAPCAAIHIAAADGNMDALRILLSDERTYIDQKDSTGFTPLMCAVINQQMEVANYLIDQGSDLSIRDDGGGNILHHCVEHPIMNRLLERILEDEYIDLNNLNFSNGGQSPLHTAVIKSNFDAVEMLLNDERVDKDRPDVDGNTPLIYASMLGFEELANEMINVHGCDPTTQNMYGHNCDDMAKLIPK